MAHLLGAESIRMSVGSRLLLDDVTLGIADGDRVGVLGPNGAGKSTLLAALAGSREVDGGRVTRSGDTRVAMLVQSDDFAPGDTVRIRMGLTRLGEGYPRRTAGRPGL